MLKPLLLLTPWSAGNIDVFIIFHDQNGMGTDVDGEVEGIFSRVEDNPAFSMG